jgi:hypothetical protein
VAQRRGGIPHFHNGSASYRKFFPSQVEAWLKSGGQQRMEVGALRRVIGFARFAARKDK